MSRCSRLPRPAPGPRTCRTCAFVTYPAAVVGDSPCIFCTNTVTCLGDDPFYTDDWAGGRCAPIRKTMKDCHAEMDLFLLVSPDFRLGGQNKKVIR